jgi:hypothetical protein
LDASAAVNGAEGLDIIAFEMSRADESASMRERYGHGNFKQKLIEHRDFLNRLKAAAESLEKRLKRGRGQPRNIVAYVVLLDLAAIFEWLTGVKARREVDRIEGIETGAFYNFCEAIWPLVFESGTDGLSTAMKNWASGHREYGEASALLANISGRYPSWRVFSR